MASTYLSRTQSASTTRTKFTFSCWVKLASTSGYRYIASSYASNDNRLGFYMHSNYGFTCYARIQGADHALRINLAQHRDVNGWYHFVVKGDTTQSSQADRIKLYTNGVEVTDYQTDSSNNLGSSDNFAFGTTGHTFYIGNYDGTQYMYDGSMSHMHFCDGYAYDPSAFGSTDSTTGEWKINTSPNVSYGTNGFFLFKDDNAVTDRSGQGNNFTLGGGTLTKTEDNPSNIFDTINANFAKTGGVNGRDSNIRVFLDNGNTRLSTDVALWTTMLGSIPMFSGKYYWECKRTYEGSPSNHLARVGIEPLDTAGTTLGSPIGTNTDSINYQTEGGGLKGNSSYSGTYASWQSNNDIVQVAVDMDNHFIYFGKNGTWQNSGDPTSGSNGTGGIAITSGSNGFTVHRGGGSAGGDKTMLKMNFGNGYFQNTAVASAGTNASGLGIFEYDVPAGYTALCTKGLNS